MSFRSSFPRLYAVARTKIAILDASDVTPRDTQMPNYGPVPTALAAAGLAAPFVAGAGLLGTSALGALGTAAKGLRGTPPRMSDLSQVLSQANRTGSTAMEQVRAGPSASGLFKRTPSPIDAASGKSPGALEQTMPRRR